LQKFLVKYFLAEKHESPLFMPIGVAAIAASMLAVTA